MILPVGADRIHCTDHTMEEEFHDNKMDELVPLAVVAADSVEGHPEAVPLPFVEEVLEVAWPVMPVRGVVQN